jgi:hypothetical protein
MEINPIVIATKQKKRVVTTAKSTKSTTTTCCDICTETLNRKTHRAITCPRFACRKVACSTCIEDYLLSQNEAQCMFCRTAFDPLWLREQMTDAFMNNRYKLHKQRKLFEFEQSLFPTTMPILDLHREVSQTNDELALMRTQLHDLKQKVYRKTTQLYRLQNRLDRAMETGGVNMEETVDAGASSEEEEKVHYRRKCAQDECPGYIHSRTGHCGSCNRHTCVKCNVGLPVGRDDEGKEVFDTRSDHQCNPDDVATWTFIKSSSKACPGCGTMINKSVGCNQMWCTQCHTPFDYVTGRRVEGAIHNPEYYNWLFNGGGAAAVQAEGGNGAAARDAEALCNPDRLPSNHRVLRVLQSKTRGGENVAGTYDVRITSALRHFLHLQEVEIPVFQRGVGDNRGLRAKNIKLRLDYLCKKITKDFFQTKIQRNDKAHQKTQEHNRIIETLVLLVSGSFNQFVTDPAITKHMLLVDLYRIQTLANEGIRRINSIFKSHLRYLSIVGPVPVIVE